MNAFCLLPTPSAMHIKIDYDTAQHRRDTCWLDWVSVAVFCMIMILYILVTAETVRRWRRGNKDIGSKGLFWHLLMYISAMGHLTAIFVSGEHFDFMISITRWHCELFDVWLNILFFASWYCFYAVFYVSTMMKNTLRVELPTHADANVRHVAARCDRQNESAAFFMDEAFGSCDSDMKDVELFDEHEEDGTTEHGESFGAFTEMYDHMSTYNTAPNTTSWLSLRKWIVGVRFLTCMAVLFPPMVLCFVGEFANQSRFDHKHTQSCTMRPGFRYTLISMLLLYVAGMWCLHAFMARGNRIPSVDKQGFFRTAVLMTCVMGVVVVMNLLGVMAFCVGRNMYFVAFVVLYTGTLYFTVVHNMIRERHREQIYMQAIEAFVVPDSFIELVALENEEGRTAVLSAFVYWMRTAPPCLATKRIVIDIDGAPDLDTFPYLENVLQLADTCREKATGFFVMFGTDLSRLYEFLLHRKALLTSGVVDDFIVGALNDSILSVMGSMDVYETMTAMRYNERQGVAIEDVQFTIQGRGTIPFTHQWCDATGHAAFQNKMRVDLFDDIQIFLEHMFQKLYYSRFLLVPMVQQARHQALEASGLVLGVLSNDELKHNELSLIVSSSLDDVTFLGGRYYCTQ